LVLAELYFCQQMPNFDFGKDDTAKKICNQMFPDGVKYLVRVVADPTCHGPYVDHT
jgi:hypothetical protein